MDSDRSHQVVDSYKKHKLNLSVFARIRALISNFEKAEIADRRVAVVGLLLIIVLILVATYFFFNSTQVVIS